MVERLKEYLSELEAEKQEIENSSDAELIAKMVEEYKAQLEADFSAKKAKSLADKAVEIAVMSRYLDKEILVEAERAAQEALMQAEELSNSVANEGTEGEGFHFSEEVSIENL